jgi:DNA-binding GntR family transcriptional regulator
LQKYPQADSSAIPLDFSNIHQGYYEEINIMETFIDYKTREGIVISSSVEKKGAKNHFTYTLKINLIVNKQHVLKKRNISAGEYIQYMSNIKKDTKTLRVKRMCLIDNSVYILLDYYPDIDG